MTDQVGALNAEPPIFQLGIQPDHGTASCTDCCIAMIVRHETGRSVSPEAVRIASGHTNDYTGLTPAEALRALSGFGVHGYQYHGGATADQALAATDNGIVLVGVGYWAYPTMTQSEVGGKDDMHFRGPHAISLWGRRNWQAQPPPEVYGHSQVPFVPGWRVWVRDPDHSQGWRYPYDRFLSTYLVHAMAAIVGNGGWTTTFMLSKKAPGVMAAAAPEAAAMAAEPEGFNTPMEQPLTPQTFD